EPEAEPRQRDRHQGERPAGEHGARDGEVVLRDPLLDQVAEDDPEHEVEGLERRELAPPDGARHEPDEQEERDGAEDDVHYGKSVIVRSTFASTVSPSRSSTSWLRWTTLDRKS